MEQFEQAGLPCSLFYYVYNGMSTMYKMQILAVSHYFTVTYRTAFSTNELFVFIMISHIQKDKVSHF